VPRLLVTGALTFLGASLLLFAAVALAPAAPNLGTSMILTRFNARSDVPAPLGPTIPPPGERPRLSAVTTPSTDRRGRFLTPKSAPAQRVWKTTPKDPGPPTELASPSSTPPDSARPSSRGAPPAITLPVVQTARLVPKAKPLGRATNVAPPSISRPTPTVTPALPIRSATDGWRQITAVEIPRIGLHSSVVFAPLVHLDGETTWSVPAFRVGHAQYTAGAGDLGNAVLIGHDTSVNAGGVFHALYRVRPGDSIRVWSGSASVTYVVSSSTIVTRTDVSVVAWTPNRALTLITCAGAWIPALDDYASRLVVRAIAAI
jgi:LPXTG-site transpeptidase (sortase) family protein